jgi:hypothetical protein
MTESETLRGRGTAICALVAITAILVGCNANTKTGSVQPNAAQALHRVEYAALPIRFEPNVGQAPQTMRYVARGADYTVAITHRGVVLHLRHIAPGVASTCCTAHVPPPSAVQAQALLGLHPVHAAGEARISAERRQGSVSNYVLGGDSSKWRRNVANYAAVRYEQIYPGIDWVVYGNREQLEYDFVVAPGADPRQIELSIEGARSAAVDDHGDLQLKVQDGTVRQLKPVIYQTAARGARHAVEGHYLLSHGHLAFALGNYDHDRALVIDPTLVFSTYFPGSIAAIASDSQGSTYIAGSTGSTNFPTQQPLQSSDLEHSSDTAFVSKFNAAGTALIYSTYLGGTGGDRSGNLDHCGPVSGPNPGGFQATTVINGGDGATAMAVDAAGNAYVAGFTSSSDFPTVGPLQASNNAAANHGANAFLAKLDATGTALVYSTYLGGSGAQGELITGDSATAVAIDGDGAAYLTGVTTSEDFPTERPFQSSNKEPAGTPTAFVAKVNAAGSALVYSSYLGGSGGTPNPGVGDCGNGIAVDAAGNAYVVGQTSSLNFPAVAALQATNHSAVENAFASKLNADGSGLVYSTYLGGSGNDAALAVAVDVSGDAYLTGFATSGDFPVAHALQPQNATGGQGANAFVTKFNPAGSGLIFSTYLGGSTYDQANALVLDAAGNAYLAGTTDSNDFPVVTPVQGMNDAASHKASNGFVTVLNSTGSALQFSSYLGGSGVEVFPPCPIGLTPCPGFYLGDGMTAIAVDAMGNLHATGIANSTDFPTASPFESTPGPAFVAEISVGQMTESSASTSASTSNNSGGGGGAIGWSVLGMLGCASAMRRRVR